MTNLCESDLGQLGDLCLQGGGAGAPSGWCLNWLVELSHHVIGHQQGWGSQTPHTLLPWHQAHRTPGPTRGLADKDAERRCTKFTYRFVYENISYVVQTQKQMEVHHLKFTETFSLEICLYFQEIGQKMDGGRFDFSETTYRCNSILMLNVLPSGPQHWSLWAWENHRPKCRCAEFAGIRAV